MYIDLEYLYFVIICKCVTFVQVKTKIWKDLKTYNIYNLFSLQYICICMTKYIFHVNKFFGICISSIYELARMRNVYRKSQNQINFSLSPESQISIGFLFRKVVSYDWMTEFWKCNELNIQREWGQGGEARTVQILTEPSSEALASSATATASPSPPLSPMGREDKSPDGLWAARCWRSSGPRGLNRTQFTSSECAASRTARRA